ncbi:putative palmitoyl acyltransferase 11 [Trypanosoma cruzi]|nr:putative palmitoyl acyltransferase 11 [Trypanosoma cruzi]
MSLLCCDPPEGQWLDVYGDPVRPRRSGFECPLDLLQIVAWSFIILLAILHYTLHVPFLENTLMIVVSIISGVLFTVTIALKVSLSLSHIEDPVIFRTDLPRLEQTGLTQEAAPPGTEPCVFCRRFVQAGSKHCGVCDKCVPGFDHHCRWLNSCVGAENYKAFCAFMGSAWCGMAFILAIGLYIIVDAILAREKYEDLLEHRYKSSNYTVFLLFLFITVALCTVGMCVLGHLIVFHLYLCCTHRTTYQHMVEKREKKRERRRLRGLQEQMQEANGGEGYGLCACLSIRKRRDFRKYKRRRMENSNTPQINDNCSAPPFPADPTWPSAHGPQEPYPSDAHEMAPISPKYD